MEVSDSQGAVNYVNFFSSFTGKKNIYYYKHYILYREI